MNNFFAELERLENSFQYKVNQLFAQFKSEAIKGIMNFNKNSQFFVITGICNTAMYPITFVNFELQVAGEIRDEFQCVESSESELANTLWRIESDYEEEGLDVPDGLVEEYQAMFEFLTNIMDTMDYFAKFHTDGLMLSFDETLYSFYDVIEAEKV